MDTRDARLIMISTFFVIVAGLQILDAYSTILLEESIEPVQFLIVWMVASPILFAAFYPVPKGLLQSVHYDDTRFTRGTVVLVILFVGSLTIALVLMGLTSLILLPSALAAFVFIGALAVQGTRLEERDSDDSARAVGMEE